MVTWEDTEIVDAEDARARARVSGADVPCGEVKEGKRIEFSVHDALTMCRLSAVRQGLLPTDEYGDGEWTIVLVDHDGEEIEYDILTIFNEGNDG